MLLPDTDNDAFKKAVDIINTTRLPVFLTGKAGTGKTTFLKYIKNNTPKNTAVVAPTGVAAINAGGTTIHSFFQLPFGPYLPNGKNNLPANYRLSAERKEVLETLELLIIDEISMVRCDMLDAIDAHIKILQKGISQTLWWRTGVIYW